MSEQLNYTILAGSIAIVLTSHNAMALQGTQVHNAFSPPKSSPLLEGHKTSAPLGHIIFCKSHPSHCRIEQRKANVRASKGRVILTKKRWRELVRINTRVNRTMIARTDQEHHGRNEYWTISTRYGDCEDYALTKRRYLIAQGWPSSALRIAVVRTHKGERHAVLVARTTQGDYVLDNLERKILPWKRTGLHWIKFQSGKNPEHWVKVTNNPSKAQKKSDTEPLAKQKQVHTASGKWSQLSQAKKKTLANLFQ